jgi:hypothetical protein
MGRYRKTEIKKALPASISLTQKHRDMMEFLENALKEHRSKIIQDLIEQKYSKIKKEGNINA